MSFGKELKRVAESKGFETQQQLADASGVSQQMVARLYLDQRPNVSAAILFKLCRALGVGCAHFEAYLSAEDESNSSAPSAKAVAAKPKPAKKPKKR